MGDDLQAHRAAAGLRSTIGLSVAHLKARSLFISDKFNEISALILSNAFDIFPVSETWLNANISSEQLMILGYNIPLRKDRVCSRGGGVAMYIADYLPYVRKYEFDSGLELLWVEVILNKFKILCGVF